MGSEFSDNDTLRDMPLFVEVARQRSFRLAAASLQVSLSLLSRRIALLEKRIGLQLLKRTTRKIELTEAGMFYLEHCQGLVEEARRVQEAVREMGATPRGHLRVSMPVDFGVTMVAPLIPDFSRRYPDITIDFDVSPQHIDLFSGQCDVALRLGMMPSATAVSHKIVSLTTHIYAAPSYLQAREVPKHPDELAQHECVRILGPSKNSTWILYRGDEKVEVPVQGRFAMNNMGMIIRMVADGMGIGIIADSVAKEQIDAGRLVGLLKSWSTSPFLVVAHTPGRLVPAKTRAFINFLRTRFTPQQL